MAEHGTSAVVAAPSEWVARALGAEAGARFVRCALQVNPFAYVQRENKPTVFANAAEYDAAIVAKCLELEIRAIAVTDHYRVETAASLIDAAEAAGIAAFPAFEAVTKDGVHCLCIFERGTPLGSLDRRIGECGIPKPSSASPPGKHDVSELLELVVGTWRGLCIPNAVISGGILERLNGQGRVAAWRSPHLHGVVLPGVVAGARPDYRAILENKDAEHRRDRPVAILNARDVYSPEDLEHPHGSCLIKMSAASLEGLRQALLDPDSRIRLLSDNEPEPHTEIVALGWEGGFLDGVTLRLSDNLNVLVGGRGAGKSTVIESVRYAMGASPVGDEAAESHRGIVQKVLEDGTRIRMLVRSHRPSTAKYLIERTVPNPPRVRRAETDEPLDVLPSDVIAGLEVYGQHEISEIARDPQRRTRLLERFVPRDTSQHGRREALRRDLADNRRKLVELAEQRSRTEAQLAELPGLRERLRRYEQAGVEVRLTERAVLVREERVLGQAEERLESLREARRDLAELLPVDRAFVQPAALAELPGRDLLAPLDAVLATLSGELTDIHAALGASIGGAESGIDDVRQKWQERRAEVEAAYALALRELQREKVDAKEFIQLRERIETLLSLDDRLTAVAQLISDLEARRRELLAEWEELKAEEVRALAAAAKGVSRRLRDRVRVSVIPSADRKPLTNLLQEEIGGRLSEACAALATRDEMSLPDLAQAWREGPEALRGRFGIPTAGQADHIAGAPPEVVMKVEELELGPRTDVELNLAAEGAPPAWRRVEDLSTGQKATAILLLLLLSSDAPLVIDQPEDDLDNRFIMDEIVKRLRDEKRRRQFLFSTHNANIPVLADAELIAGLSVYGQEGDLQAEVAPEHLGSIDQSSVRDLISELLEGGQEAFERRRQKYGF